MGDYSVTYISSENVFTDITKFVHSLDKTSFYSDGRIYTTALTLQAEFGQFMTDSRDGSTPIIKQFDRIQIRYTDSNGNFYEHIFQVINNLGQGTYQADYLLPLTLEGREQNMAFIPFSGYFDPPISHKDISQKILSVYGFSKDIFTQPTISDQFPGTNELPTFSRNFWDFQYIDNCLDAMKEIVRSADLSVAGGGGGDRFSIVFKDIQEGTAVALDIMAIDIASQGTTNAGDPFVTITGDAVFNPIQIIDKVKQPFTGTVIIARGRPGSGGTPRQGDQYRARLEFYETTPSYVDTTQYLQGAFVSFGPQITNTELASPQVYQADVDTQGNLPTNATFWTPISAFVFIGDIQYSPLTEDKKDLYKNECTNPGVAFDFNSESSPKMLDCNIVINDVETQRDWVYFRSNTDVAANLPTGTEQYLFEGTSYYSGFRILVDVSNLGTGAGTFSPNSNFFDTGLGRDPNGKLYANNAVIFVSGTDNLNPLGQGGTWYVIKEHADFDQIVVRFEGLFEFNIDFVTGSRFPASDVTNINRRTRSENGGIPFAWQPLRNQFLANDCLHSPSSIENVAGLTKTVNRDSGDPTYQTNSAVQIIYEYGTIGANEPIEEWRMILDQIAGTIITTSGGVGFWAATAISIAFNLFLKPQYTNVGWWITFTTPWPFNTFNNITEPVGGIYGGQNLPELQDHPYFDAFNQRVAYSGKAGWNEEDSADLMEITGVKFLYKLDIQANGVTIPFTGNIPCSYWCIDDNGTIWKQKKNYPFLKDVWEFQFDFGDFTPVYRARSPYGIENIVTNILVPELEIRERLFPARIKIQGFMLELAYDDHGRYMPSVLENIIKPTIFRMFAPTTPTASFNVQFIGTIDAFQWIKTPIAIETGSSLGETPDRIIFPAFRDYPNITNIEQLQRAATADFDVEFFQYEQYTLIQNDRADIKLQDTVYLRDPFLIPDADQTIAKTNAFENATTYTLNDIVNSAGIIYSSLQSPNQGNTPNTNPEFWEDLGSIAVPNTREVVLSEMVLSVTNGKDWNREATFVRRIPRKIG